MRQKLERLPLKLNYNVLCGLTGTGKTNLLHQLSQKGYQVLDLEKIVNHRGSLLGQEWQKSQRINLHKNILIHFYYNNLKALILLNLYGVNHKVIKSVKLTCLQNSGIR